MNTRTKLLFAGIMTALGIKTMTAQSMTRNFMVLGNCGMCERTIEKAALNNGASTASWDKDTKILTVNFNQKKTNANDILKGVAYAGYDNEKYLAPKDAYNNLHSCCKYERTKIRHSTDQVITQAKATTEKTAQQTQKKNQLETVYNKYFEMKDALIKGDGKTAAEKAKEIVRLFDAINTGTMGENDRKSLEKNLERLKNDANNIGGAKDIKKQRAYFSSLSDTVYELMKVAKPSYTVYLENCPMFNNGKGANWISKESDIKNPYYGSQMMKCGKVIETLKQ